MDRLAILYYKILVINDFYRSINIGTHPLERGRDALAHKARISC